MPYKNHLHNANVKIADIRDPIVFETQAQDGTTLWDGIRFHAKGVSTGFYIVFSTFQDNFGKADALVGKVMFVN